MTPIMRHETYDPPFRIHGFNRDDKGRRVVGCLVGPEDEHPVYFVMLEDGEVIRVDPRHRALRWRADVPELRMAAGFLTRDVCQLCAAPLEGVMLLPIVPAPAWYRDHRQQGERTGLPTEVIVCQACRVNPERARGRFGPHRDWR